MSDDLSPMIRAAVDAETAAAEREFPYTPATLGAFVGAVRRRRAAGGAMLAVAGLAVLGAAVLGVGQPWQSPPPVTEPIEPTPTTSATPTVTPTPPTTPTPSPTVDPTPSAGPSAQGPEQTTAPPAPPAPPAAVPGKVTVIDAGAGGGSGEVLVAWEPVADATGYRIYRSETADGPFVLSATFVAATGTTTIQYSGWYEYIQVWTPSSAPHSHQYVEAVNGGPTWFRVSGFSAAGEGPLSSVVCGNSIGNPDC